MDLVGLCLSLGVGLLLLFLTWQARRSGEIRLRTSTLLRAESPTSFQIVLVLRGLFGVFLMVVAIWGVLHPAPTG